MNYPPYERDFSEYSNIFDSRFALAAGGNMAAMGAIGIDTDGTTGAGAPSFTLSIGLSDVPTDATQCMRIFYATKHQLDSSASTIPEIHKDIIVLGAVAYCLEAYQTPTNDNFEFHDGALHDQVNDSMIPTSWLKTAEYKMKQFMERLEEIKRQRDFATSARAQWGDVPYRWGRL
jgi:hypothetical protein